jgi:mono/diheme cytochrome c family protein
LIVFFALFAPLGVTSSRVQPDEERRKLRAKAQRAQRRKRRETDEIAYRGGMLSLSRVASFLCNEGCVPFAKKHAKKQASLKQRVEDRFNANCYRCHGQDGENEEGLN